MYRAILPEGQLRCERYEPTDHGLELFGEEDQFLAFVPYANLQALIDEAVYEDDDPSIV